MTIISDIEERKAMVDSRSTISGETINALSNIKSASPVDVTKKRLEKTNYINFYLLNEFVRSGNEKKLISSKIINNNDEIIMDSAEEIKVIMLASTTYLIVSLDRALIIEASTDEASVIASVSGYKTNEMYKITKYLNDNGLVVLTDYSQDEKRNFEYLYDYRTGRRISSGFDSIDENNGSLKVSFGLATGNLDLEGNFCLDPDEDEKPQGFFSRLFNRSKC